MNYINCTPHAINIHTDKGILSLPPSGTVMRVSTEVKHLWTLNDVKIFENRKGALDFGGIELEEDKIYIVSFMVLEAAKSLGYKNFAAPHDLVRDENGNVTGCRGLCI